MKVDAGPRTRAGAGDTVKAAKPLVIPQQVWPALAFGGVLVVSTVLRFWTRSDLWFDEALSVNIARLPLDRIADALRHDGHPPLYYFLLHGWISVFGIGDLAVRSLSGVISMATLPLAWFAGRQLGGRTLAWCTVLVLATSPFAFRYATEARMYSLVMFLVVAGYLGLRRALEKPSMGRLALVAVIAAALELTQYWDLYLVALVGAALAVRAWRTTGVERRAAVRTFGAIAVASLAFVPWLPVFFDQLAHTGTPWGDPQFPWVVLPNSLIAFAGSPEDGEAFVLAFLLVVLALLAVFGRGLDERRIELDVRTMPAVRWEAGAAFGALMGGASIAYLSGTTFQPRYAASVFPLFVLAVAFGLTVFLDARIRLVLLASVVALGLAGGVRNTTTNRTQASQSAGVIAAESKPGDLVVYCPDQLGPDVSRLLRDVRGLHQVTFPDFTRPERVNWTDYLDRVDRADAPAFARKVLDRAKGHTIWLVSEPSLNHFRVKCTVVSNVLGAARTPRTRVLSSDGFFEFMGLTEYPAP